MLLTQISEIQRETAMDMLQQCKKRLFFQYALGELKKIY